jgi:hypothetical protein
VTRSVLSSQRSVCHSRHPLFRNGTFWLNGTAIVGAAPHPFRPMYDPRHAGAGLANMG